MIIPKNLVDKKLKYFTCCHQNLPQVVFSFSLMSAFEIIMLETGSAAILVCLGWSHFFAELGQAGYSTVIT